MLSTHISRYGPPPYCPPPVPQLPRWSAEDEEVKYGPFSDGEADTVSRILSTYISLLHL